MAKFPLQIKVSLLLIISLIMISSAGYLTYLNISTIISTLKNQRNPDFRLLSLKDLSADLNETDNSVRLFMVTDEPAYLNPLTLLKETYEERTDELFNYYQGMPYQQAIIDSIKILIPEQLALWGQMIQIEDSSRLSHAIDELSVKYLSPSEDSIMSQNIPDENISVADEKESNPPEPDEEVEVYRKVFPGSEKSDEELSAEENQEKGFFKRIFQRNKPPSEEDHVQKFIPHKDTIKVAFDTIPPQDSTGIVLKEELSKLEELKKLDSLATRKARIQELSLLEKNKELFASLNLLIKQIEDEEDQVLANEARKADNLAEETFQWLMIFSVSIFFLLIILFVVIINYIRKTQATQKAMLSAKLQAENLAHTKELFIANVSHEMRTPMNAIYGLSDQLLMRDDISPDLHDQVEVISKSANHLISVINEILDFSKIQSGKIQLEEIDFSLRPLLEEVVQLNRFFALRKNIGLTLSTDYSIPDAFQGDPVRLKQVLLNLVGNAVKFTDFGEVRIVAKAIPKSSKIVELIIDIEDTGIGIDEERIEYLFEDFTQEDSTTSRKYGGTGLGLAIAKKLVLLMGGTISVKSMKNSWTVFNLKLPIRIGNEANIKDEQSVSQLPKISYKGLRALIVDDEEYNRLVLRLIMKKWKIEFEEAENGEIALEKIKNRKFDVILMDIRMPIMDGIKATELIRNDATLPPELKIIGLSAINAKEDVQASIAAGMDSFILKPFSERSLRKAFEYLIHRQPENSSEEKVDIEEISAAVSNDIPDFEALNRLGGGDSAFTSELLQVFVKNSEKSIDEMKICLEKKNYRCIADIAHRASSSCKHLNALTLFRILREIESVARDETELLKLPALIEQANRERVTFIVPVLEYIERIEEAPGHK